MKRIGLADGKEDADGKTIMDFWQARHRHSERRSVAGYGRVGDPQAGLPPPSKPAERLLCLQHQVTPKPFRSPCATACQPLSCLNWTTGAVRRSAGHLPGHTQPLLGLALLRPFGSPNLKVFPRRHRQRSPALVNVTLRYRPSHRHFSPRSLQSVAFWQQFSYVSRCHVGRPHSAAGRTPPRPNPFRSPRATVCARIRWRIPSLSPVACVPGDFLERREGAGKRDHAD
jgi:hypothetical protein